MKKTLLVLLLVFMAMPFSALLAQTRSVTGTVTSSEDGSGIPGVNVLIQGTTTGVTTDIDGNYKINVPSGDATLLFSYIGFLTQEIAVNSQSVINVELVPDVTRLEEIVVTGSAVGQSQKTVSFSVGKIDEKLIKEVPAPNLGAGLQGKIAGLRVVSGGGQPGSGVAFQARAANSLTAGQNPLVIVDGVFLNGTTLSDINPEDIERIEVLKGSAGASLYGSQAANGVVQIFTKRGAGIDEGKTRVIYRGEYGVSQLATDRFPTATTHHYQVDGSGNFVFDGSGSRVIDDDQLADNPWPNFQDYQDLLFRDGYFGSHYVAVSGRSKTTNFLLSGQRFDQTGVIDGVDGYERNSFRLNVDHRLSDKVDVQVSSMYSTSTQDRLPANGTTALINNIVFFPPFYDLSTPNEEDGSLYDWDIDSLGSTIRNPLYTLHNRETTVDRTRLITNFKVNYDATDWLSFNASAALDRSTNKFEEFIRKGFLSDDLRAGVQFDPTNQANGPGGGLERSTRINNSFIGRVNAIVQKSFGEFNSAIRLSYLYEDLTIDFNSARGDDLAVSGIRSLDNITQNFRLQSHAEEIIANSFFAIADIDYQKKYIFSGLIRREGSSLFGPDERWATYFRASGAYRLTEDFDIPGFQELKVRASYGTAGIRPTFEQRFETFTLQNGSFSPGTLGNTFLTPARSGELELGLNAFFLNRFDLEFNYAKTKTEDQVLRVPLSGAAGFSAQWRNAGTIEANTFELSLNTTILDQGDFKWNLLINWDRTTQEITQLDVPAYNTGPGNQQSTIFRIEEGVSFGAMRGQVFATNLDQIRAMELDPSEYTINAVGFVVRNDEIGTTSEAPVKLVDAAGNPVVDIIGDINPDFRMGFANNFSWKNISLYALFDWKKGGDIYNQTRQWLFRDLIHEDVGKYPIATNFWNNLYNVNVPNNAFVEDGTFFMLRELGVSYEFKKEQLSKIFGNAIQGIRLGFVGRNLFTVTDYSGFHPDITSVPRDENQLTDRVQDGVGSDANTPNGDPNLFYFDSFVYPQTKTFTGSIQITF
ncbi:SusC/RagA family TonB-linked outer membrane protein [Fulvivirgaceae bacterium BMA10]|uniref:SusC/RagA family TonB-linked outer membrane protein n=1 Tax=Splendidivirga corallicola TaxID=3051826 RepID=A0ABT8KT40_9BACT|nr:SusC/RagA family TonB-linked outer membrane protein [Fulvivirgaceae bacterium BMA10]